MKRLLISLLASLTTLSAMAQVSFGDAVRFDNGWRFHLGDTPEAVADGFDDSRWQAVTLPHDWSVKGTLSPANASGTGYLPAGIGWYRKTFDGRDLTAAQMYIYFEGVYNRSSVWLNGHLLGERPNGYISFLYDLTPWLRRDGQNVLAVRVDHSRIADSRFYTGSGIYRDVWLVSAGPVHFAQWGVGWQARTLTDRQAVIAVDAAIEGLDGRKAQLRLTLRDASGAVVSRAAARAAASQTVDLKLARPHRWDLDDPYLYTLEAEIVEGKTVLDRMQTSVGLREIRFDADKGFALNGRTRKIKGVCLHHDAGVLGAAVPEEVWERRLRNLKAIGANAIRTSHNPQAPVFYDLCDRIGLLVMDEAFDEWEFPKRKWVEGWNVGTPALDGTFDFFNEWGETDVRDMVRRDRNHPSIILWSIGNEVDYPNDPYSHPILDGGNNDFKQPAYGGYNPDAPRAERIGEIAQRLAAAVRSVDTSRPVTGALAGVAMSNQTAYPEAVDVVGYNYTESRYVEDHKKYPKRVIYGSENRHDQAAWDAVTKNEHIFGQFLWTGIDYLGESGPWPARGSEAGLIDLAGFVKPQGWRRAQMWGGEVPDSILRLFAAGQRAMPQSGRPHALRATLREPMDTLRRGRVAQVVVEVVDEKGRLVWMADNEVTCRIQGPARLLGMENGNIRDTSDKTQSRCRVKNGRLVAYVTLGEGQQVREGRRGSDRREVMLPPGVVVISVTSPYLDAGRLVMQAETR